MNFPEARRAGLTVRELAEETLVYDLERNKAHCLNRTAGLVWRHCDGRTTRGQLAGMLHEKLGLPADEILVQLALEQLGRRHLLVEPVSRSDEVRSRRDALKKLLAVCSAFPVVMTITSRLAAAQGSSQCGGPCQIVNVGTDPCSAIAQVCFCDNQTGGMGTCIKG